MQYIKIKNFLRNKKVQFYIKLFFFLIILYLLYNNIDFNFLLELIKIDNNFFYFFVIIILVRLIVIFLMSLRWNLLINISNNTKFYLKNTLGSLLYSNLASEFFFFGILARSSLKITEGVNIKNIASSVLIEKILSTYFLLIISIIFFIIFLISYENDLIKYRNLLIMLSIFSIFFVTVFLFVYEKLLKFSLLKKLYFFLHYFFGNLLFAKRLKTPFIFSALIHIVTILQIIFIVFMLNFDIDLYKFTLLLPITLLIAAIPVTISEWGWRELIFINILTLSNLSNEQSFSISVSLGIINMIAALLSVIIYQLKYN